MYEFNSICDNVRYFEHFPRIYLYTVIRLSATVINLASMGNSVILFFLPILSEPSLFSVWNSFHKGISHEVELLLFFHGNCFFAIVCVRSF